MDETYFLVLLVAVVVAMLALARMITRPQAAARQGAGESPIGVSTEGMKVCPRCGMGNLWTERRCSSCSTPLKG